MLYNDSLLFEIISSWLSKLQHNFEDQQVNKIAQLLHQVLLKFHQKIFPAFEAKKIPSIIILRHLAVMKNLDVIKKNPLYKQYAQATKFINHFAQEIAKAKPEEVNARAMCIIESYFQDQATQAAIKASFLRLAPPSQPNFRHMFAIEVLGYYNKEFSTLILDLFEELEKLPEHLDELFPGFNHEKFYSSFLVKIPFLSLPYIEHLNSKQSTPSSTRGSATMTFVIQVNSSTYANAEMIQKVSAQPDSPELGIIYLIATSTANEYLYRIKTSADTIKAGTIENVAEGASFYANALAKIQAQGHAQTITFDADQAYQDFKQTYSALTTPAASPSSHDSSNSHLPDQLLSALQQQITAQLVKTERELTELNQNIRGFKTNIQELVFLEEFISDAIKTQRYSPEKSIREQTAKLIGLDEKTKLWLENKHENLPHNKKPKFFRLLGETQTAIDRQLQLFKDELNSDNRRKKSLKDQQQSFLTLQTEINALTSQNCKSLLEKLTDSSLSSVKASIEQWMDEQFQLAFASAKQNFLTNLAAPEDLGHLLRADAALDLQQKYQDLQLIRKYLANPSADFTEHDEEIKTKISEHYRHFIAQKIFDERNYQDVVSKIQFYAEEGPAPQNVIQFSDELIQTLSTISAEFSLSTTARKCINDIMGDVQAWQHTHDPANENNYHCLQLKIRARLLLIEKDYTKNPNWVIVMNIIIGLLTVGIAHMVKYASSSNPNPVDRLSFFRPAAFSNTLASLNETFSTKSPLVQRESMGL